MLNIPKKQNGFTIVELLIVIVVIAILAAITIVAYNGVTARAATSRQAAEVNELVKAINAARLISGKTLYGITGSGYSYGNCNNAYGYNPSDVEPNQLPKTSNCWKAYYNILNTVGSASGMNLSGLMNGDPYGNPYMLDENEADYPGHCARDSLYTFKHDGTDAVNLAAAIPPQFCTNYTYLNTSFTL